MAEEVKKIKADNKNIDKYKSLNKNEIEKLVNSEATKFINLFHKRFFEFYENWIKKEEASADADLDSEDVVINDILCKIVTKIGSPINLDKEEKKENKEGKERSLGHEKPEFLKIIDNIFHSIFDRTKKTQWQEQGEA